MMRLLAVPVTSRQSTRERLGKLTSFCGTSEGAWGPVQHKLAGYGRVRGIVFGAFGEASADAHDLVRALADESASRAWVQLG